MFFLTCFSVDSVRQLSMGELCSSLVANTTHHTHTTHTHHTHHTHTTHTHHTHITDTTHTPHTPHTPHSPHTTHTPHTPHTPHIRSQFGSSRGYPQRISAAWVVSLKATCSRHDLFQGSCQELVEREMMKVVLVFGAVSIAGAKFDAVSGQKLGSGDSGVSPVDGFSAGIAATLFLWSAALPSFDGLGHGHDAAPSATLMVRIGGEFLDSGETDLLRKMVEWAATCGVLAAMLAAAGGCFSCSCCFQPFSFTCSCFADAGCDAECKRNEVVPVDCFKVDAREISVPMDTVKVVACEISVPMDNVKVVAREISVPMDNVKVVAREISVSMDTVKVLAREISVPTDTVKVVAREISVLHGQCEGDCSRDPGPHGLREGVLA